MKFLRVNLSYNLLLQTELTCTQMIITALAMQTQLVYKVTAQS
jgi:hypothetical protein